MTLKRNSRTRDTVCSTLMLTAHLTCWQTRMEKRADEKCRKCIIKINNLQGASTERRSTKHMMMESTIDKPIRLRMPWRTCEHHNMGQCKWTRMHLTAESKTWDAKTLSTNEPLSCSRWLWRQNRSPCIAFALLSFNKQYVMARYVGMAEPNRAYALRSCTRHIRSTLSLPYSFIILCTIQYANSSAKTVFKCWQKKTEFEMSFLPVFAPSKNS